jgi:hypothetical protein
LLVNGHWALGIWGTIGKTVKSNDFLELENG